MPTVPANLYQLAGLFLLILPGTAYQFVRSRLRGPAVDDSITLNRILRVITTSVILDLAYVVLGGRHIYVAVTEAREFAMGREISNIRFLGFWAFILLFAAPAGLAFVDYSRMRLNFRLRLPGLTYDPTFPNSWDYAFNRRHPCFVRILMIDGQWLGGYWDEKSWVSSYPEPKDIYIGQAYSMSREGGFGDPIPLGQGIYVRCEDVRSVEFIQKDDD